MSEKVKDDSVMKMLGLEEIPPDQLRSERERITWNHLFLYEAWLWSSHSHDPQTQCGCVLVKNNTIISTGYNGFIRGIDDKALPNMRPYKYDFMVHAEHNAILNCARNGISTMGAKAYITGEPCNWCLQYMWQAGISSIIYSDFNKPTMCNNSKHNKIKQALLHLMNPPYVWNRIYIEYVPSIDLYNDSKKLFPINIDKKDSTRI